MNNEVAKLRDLDLEAESLKARKNAIKQKLAEHRDEFSASQETRTETRSELEKINQRLTEIQSARSAIAELAQKNQNMEERKIKMENMENNKVNLRTAFAKQVLFMSTKRADAKLNEAEMRALGVATTTTSNTYVAATSEVDGINNGGVFIPESVVLDILKEESVESPIYNDIKATAIKGKVKFPYLFQKTGAKTKAELAKTENENVEWKILSGVTGNYTDSIVLTFEEEAMAIDEFADYLISLIKDSMRELLISDYIYGTGLNDHVKGITNGAIDATYTAANAEKYRANIEAAIKLLPTKKRAGAKIYVASDIFDGITFEKNSNGDYILPVLNGGGLNRISAFPVEMDANLNAGDFIIGNIGKWYKANINKTMEVGLDISHTNRTKTYATHMMVTAAPVPNSFVYGKKQS